MIQKIKNNKLLIEISLPFLIFIITIAKKIISKKELFIDKFAYNTIVKKMRNKKLTSFMKIITKLSNTKFILFATIILLLICIFKLKNKRLAIASGANLGGIVFTNQILKMIFKRERPIGYRLIKMGGYSFPSGHAMVSMAFYGLLIYIVFHTIKNTKLRNILIILNILIIILIGFSRVYLGVHYLSDVLTGYSISIIYLLLTTKLIKKYKALH